MNESGHETADERPATPLTARVVLCCVVVLFISHQPPDHRAQSYNNAFAFLSRRHY